MMAPSALAAWSGPLAIAALALAVFRGDAHAPLLALVLLVAALVPALCPLDDGVAPARSVATVVSLVAVALALAAQLRFLADVAVVSGARLRVTIAVTAALATLCALWPGRLRWWSCLLPASLAAIGVPLLATVLSSGVTPWAAWRAVATRPALVFTEGSPWTREGGHVVTAATLAFTEAHRVTAVAPGVVRVIERDGARDATREWRLGAGESLPLRPGDRLAVPGGSRLRFESGKRVPGAPTSGTTWADPDAAARGRALGLLAALALTIVGGALALGGPGAGSARAAALVAPALALASMAAGLTWGVYAAHRAPELTLGAPPLGAMVGLPLYAAARPWSTALTLCLSAGLVGFFASTARALAQHLDLALGGSRGGAGGWAPRMAFVGALSVGAVTASASGDAWLFLMTALGLAATGLTAPALASRDPRARAVGALAGMLAFVIVAGAGWLTRSAPLPGEVPVLIAAPLAWASARVRALYCHAPGDAP
jgi:hypothetical protein